MKINSSLSGIYSSAQDRPTAATRPQNVGANSIQADLAEQSQIRNLENQDRQVRNHEQAHLAAAGGIAIGAPHFRYTTGPDGKLYAISGDVSIDASEVGNDPQATLRKAETIRKAALAPADPSGQDMRVAAEAAAMALKAASELAQQQTDPIGGLINLLA